MLHINVVLILTILCATFFLLFVFKSTVSMTTIPFHDFDEAHRAENAKRMKEYFSFLVPLSGSPQDRTPDLKVPVRGNRNLFLYYHPERPPFVYWLMIASTSIFGQIEWAYRLPSLLMAILTIVIFVLFTQIKSRKLKLIPSFVGLVCLLTSLDLWLSGQYAQLDTSLTFFLILSLLSLIFYVENKRNELLILSGLSLSLAILSKGQPAVIILFPLLFLLFSKRLALRNFYKFCLYSSIILLPWLFLLNIYFGLPKVMSIFTGFATSSIIHEYAHISAPIFWYGRWWWDSLRPGFTLFLALLLFDLIHKTFGWKKITLLNYIFGGLLLFSFSANKIWWYVLPLIPALCFYIYLSSADYLKSTGRLVNISIVLILASLPVLFGQTNKITLIYGLSITIICLFILSKNLSFLAPIRQVLIILALILSLFSFSSHFPKIIPYHQNTKFVASYFAHLEGRKCLYVYDMPAETALFYANAKEILPLTQNTNLLPDCQDYLITPVENLNDISYFYREKQYLVSTRPILFQKGSMKLIKLNPE